MSNNKIILAAGGTGGHLSPALAVADILSKKGYDVILYTDQRCKRYLPAGDISYKIIINKDYPFSKNPVKFLFWTLLLIKNIFLIINRIYRDKIFLIISFGGYTSFAANISATIMFRKLIIHEQNSVLGRQNRCFVRLANYVAYSFPYTKGLEKTKKSKIVNTGMPVRGNFTDQENINKKKFVILIMGGSQGAKFLDIRIAQMIRYLDRSILSNLKIIQQVRQEHLDEMKQFYHSLKMEFELQSYFGDIDSKLKEADLVVSRAGAATLSEIIHAKKAAILIPYPSAKDNHQYLNAKYLADNNAAIVLEENNVKVQNLQDAILNFVKNPEYKEEIENNISTLTSFSDSKRFIKLIDQIMLGN